MKCRRILIIDDDPDTRSVIEHLLLARNFSVQIAQNGKEALEILMTDPLPDIILLDLDMPVMTGWDFLKIQKTTPRLSSIPSLVYTSREYRAEMTSRRDRYLSKKSGLDDLLRSLERICEEERIPSGAAEAQGPQRAQGRQLEFGIS